MRDVDDERLERNLWGRYKMGRPILYLFRRLILFGPLEKISFRAAY